MRTKESIGLVMFKFNTCYEQFNTVQLWRPIATWGYDSEEIDKQYTKLQAPKEKTCTVIRYYKDLYYNKNKIK